MSRKTLAPLLLCAGGVVAALSAFLTWRTNALLGDVRGIDVNAGPYVLGTAIATILLGLLTLVTPNKLVQLLARISGGGLFVWGGLLVLGNETVNSPGDHSAPGIYVLLAGVLLALVGGVMLPGVRDAPASTPPPAV